MAFQLLEHLAADVPAAQNRQNLNQRADCGPRAESAQILCMIEKLLIEELDAKKGSHALRQWLLELERRLFR